MKRSRVAKQGEMTDSLRAEQLARLLRMPLKINGGGRRVVESGPGAQDEVVTSSRLILILRGGMDYSVEGHRFAVEAGTEFLVPAWVRRVWGVALRSPCEIVWCEFDDDPLAGGRGAVYGRRLQGVEWEREKHRFAELLGSAGAAAERRPLRTQLRNLAAEGLLKAMLSRFWVEARRLPGLPGGPVHARGEQAPLHAAVRDGLRWLDAHACEADPVGALYRECALTPNYFRRLFREGLQCTPQQHVLRLRLRRARQLIHSTGWQQKRIAAEVGFADPLYFSRMYKRFWGYPPSEERESKEP